MGKKIETIKNRWATREYAAAWAEDVETLLQEIARLHDVIGDMKEAAGMVDRYTKELKDRIRELEKQEQL